MFKPAQELRRALHAGVTAYSITLLALALFSSPLAAAHFDFGHSHAATTPAHTHSLASVFSSTPSLTTVTLLGVAALPFAFCGVASSVILSFISQLPVGSRAPPVALP